MATNQANMKGIDIYEITIYMATNQAKMKGIDIYDGAVMIFLNYPLIILLWETWTKKLRTNVFGYMVLLKILDKILHTCLHPS
jgi:hypothetical protein